MHAQMNGWTERQMAGRIYKEREREKRLLVPKTAKNIRQHIKKHKGVKYPF